MKLRLLPAAIDRIDAGRAWWLGNRDKAPYLFDEELADALELITESPTAGQRVALGTGRSVYRTLMPKTAAVLLSADRIIERQSDPPGATMSIFWSSFVPTVENPFCV